VESDKGLSAKEVRGGMTVGGWREPHLGKKKVVEGILLYSTVQIEQESKHIWGGDYKEKELS